VRPTVYLGLARGKARWTVRDRCLAEALLHYERSLNSLGMPDWIALDPEREWVIDEVGIDKAAAVLEEAHEEYRKGQSQAKGLRLAVVPAPVRKAREVS
jgi:hypothetical protein